MKIYYNGQVITMKDERDTGNTAVCVNDGVIVAVGTDKDILKFKNETTELIDLEGKTMLPGFIDPHSHFAIAAKVASFVNIAPSPIGDVNNIDKMVEVLKNAIKPDTTLILGNGYDNNELDEKRNPTKEDLDKVSTEIPVIAIHVSGHVGSLNSKALEMFNINAETPNPEGGVIKRKDGSQEPTGYLEENAIMPIIFSQLPQVNDEKVDGIAKVGQHVYTQNGITTCQDGLIGNTDFAFYDGAARHEALDIDVIGYAGALVPNKWKTGEFGLKVGDKLGTFTYGGYKMFLDGSPQARTAWLSKPYEVVKEDDDPLYVGYPIYDDATVIDGIKMCIEENAQFLVHCNGDEASEQFIRCYEEALKDVQPNKEIRPVMVHCQLLRSDQMDRMKALGIIPTFFVVHTYYFGDTHIMNFGEERASSISNMRYAIDNGLTWTTHEDTPVAPPKVMFSIWSAVNRITRTGKTLGEDYKISVYEALQAYTINGAYQYFEEDIKGTIQPGKVADLVILDKNPLTVDPMELKDVQVIETIKKGKVVYSK